MLALRFAVALVLCVAFHALGARLWPGLSSLLNLLLVLTVLNALRGNSLAGLGGGLAAGLARDALSGALYGLFGFADTIVGYVAARVAQRLVIERASGIMLVVALATLLQQALIAGLVALFSLPAQPPDLLWSSIQAIVNGVAALLLIGAFTRWRQLRETRHRSRLSRLRH